MPNYSVNRTLTRCAGSRRLPQALCCTRRGFRKFVSPACGLPQRRFVRPARGRVGSHSQRCVTSEVASAVLTSRCAVGLVACFAQPNCWRQARPLCCVARSLTMCAACRRWSVVSAGGMGAYSAAGAADPGCRWFVASRSAAT
jgi:hypothetical protein